MRPLRHRVHPRHDPDERQECAPRRGPVSASPQPYLWHPQPQRAVGPLTPEPPPRASGQQALSCGDKRISIPGPGRISGEDTGRSPGPEPEPRVQPAKLELGSPAPRPLRASPNSKPLCKGDALAHPRLSSSSSLAGSPSRKRARSSPTLLPTGCP
ncbi:uncharacterized protein [Symphalangus syndactylus]|uniref:uncharacterized protein isoform X2 n=1 Tax=Symphalangus syndactylus TaxID=9590 RepID=UPI0024410204|nr:uncharacterized protein LOC129460118 isoform X2 [Symphalangus syndactylus]